MHFHLKNICKCILKIEGFQLQNQFFLLQSIYIEGSFKKLNFNIAQFNKILTALKKLQPYSILKDKLSKPHRRTHTHLFLFLNLERESEHTLEIIKTLSRLIQMFVQKYLDLDFQHVVYSANFCYKMKLNKKYSDDDYCKINN